jgi:hypothetical protein
MYLYPQNLPHNKDVGARTYLKMLKAFYGGVKRGARHDVVIAGTTSPRGTGNTNSDTPQRFARYLKRHGAADYFDAYSHHPYPPSGTRARKPSGKPNNPSRAVSLGNLEALLSLFPHKPFYLTEYGYNTSKSFFGANVSEAVQARYMRQAYNLVSQRYPQVKALLWYLVQDVDSTATRKGLYMGLQDTSGRRKPAWYAFAGDNWLSIEAPSSAPAWEAFEISGAVTCRNFNPVAYQVLTLQRRKLPHGRWVTVTEGSTESDGTYGFWVLQNGTRCYRVEWNGVQISASRTVRTP